MLEPAARDDRAVSERQFAPIVDRDADEDELVRLELRAERLREPLCPRLCSRYAKYAALLTCRELSRSLQRISRRAS